MQRTALCNRASNGMHPSEAAKRCNFEDMTPIFPNQRMRMERDSRRCSHAYRGPDLTDRQGTARNDRFSAESRKDDTC